MLKGNNRIVLGLVFTLSLTGCGLISDWQAIMNRDRCSLNISVLNTSILEYHGNISDTSEETSNLSSNLSVSISEQLLENCEAQINHQCFWNPHSRVTGENCNTYFHACLSQQTSLTFYQFNVGVFLVAVGSLLGYIVLNALTSDIASVESLVT